MKILLFAEVYYPDVMGGGEFSTKQMAEGLVKKGHEVIVYCLGKNNCVEEIKGVRVNRQYKKGFSEHFMSLTKNNRTPDTFTLPGKIRRKWPDIYRSRKWYEGYRSVIKKEDPDLVHTVSPMSYLGRANLWRAASVLKIPVSHVSRSLNLLELKFLGGRLDAYYISQNVKASSCLTALAAPSRFILDCHNRVGIRGQRFNDVIYNAVDFTPVLPSADLITQKENMVLYAGEFRKEKGIHNLIQAMDGMEGIRLFLIGRGELMESFKKEGKANVIDWMERESLYNYMKKAKAVILPSEWNEPFGRILIESIDNGTIGIGSDRGGIPEVLGFNYDYIFQSGDVGGLRRRIEKVISMPSYVYMEEVAGQQKVISGLTNESYVDNWERFFLQQLT